MNAPLSFLEDYAFAYARVKMMSARQAVGPSADETATNLATRPEGSAARLRFTKDWSLEEIIPAPNIRSCLLSPLPKRSVAAVDLGAINAFTYSMAQAQPRVEPSSNQSGRV